MRRTARRPGCWVQSEQGVGGQGNRWGQVPGILSQAQWMPLDADLTKVVNDHSGSSAISSLR